MTKGISNGAKRHALFGFWKGSKLQKRFLVFFVALAVLPVLALGGVSLLLLDRSHEQDAAALQEQLLSQKAKEIEKFFADTAGVLELKVGLEENAPLSFEDQEFLLDGLLTDNAAFEEIRFITLDGNESSKKNRAGQEQALAEVSGRGEFLLPSQGTSYVSEVYYQNGTPLVTLASPVRNRPGDVIQILAAEVNLSEVTESIQQATLGNKGYVKLQDRTGIEIASGPSALGEESYQTSLVLQEPNWTLLTVWPVRDADAIIINVRNQVILVILLSVLGVLLVASFLAHRLVAPIRAMQQSAAAIEKGDFEEQVVVTTGDELEELGDSFNKMRQGLQRLRELQNEFVFVAAHELRAPVTAVHWYLSGIFADAKNQAIHKVLQPVKDANDRLTQLVQDLLEIARADAGRLKVKVKAFDLSALSQSVVAEMNPLAQRHNVSLCYEQGDIPQVLADEGRLKEVLVNLVSNAIKYNNKGGSVVISHESTRGLVLTHVKDNGLGIPQKDQKHVFEKFFRVEGKDRADIEGTGLGLFITKQLVERMQGSIWFSSIEGKGTTFSFQLPAIKQTSV